MKKNDLATLRDMQEEVGTHLTAGLGHVVERLLRLRDCLSFDDTSWYHDFTQHVVTLDSAYTFHPASDAEERQKDAAVQQAVCQIIYLIEAKMVESSG